MNINKQVLSFIKKYTSDLDLTNRLIVSAFLHYRNNLIINNNLIGSLIIKPKDSDFTILSELLEIQKEYSFEELIELFEFVISPADKRVTGAIYTPEYIRRFIISNVLDELPYLNNLKICDPACGCSGFLYTAALQIKAATTRTYHEIFAENLFGVDIQEYSITRSKILLSLLAIVNGEDHVEFEFNLIRANSLSTDWQHSFPNFEGFDAIVGNPPYVCSRHIDDESKRLLNNWSVCSSGHPDLYIPFFQVGLNALKDGGILGYITMNTFFNSINGSALRNFFEEARFKIEIIDFGGIQIFNNKATYTCICQVKKVNSDIIKYSKVEKLESFVKYDLVFNEIKYESLSYGSGWSFHHFDIIQRIQNTGIPLGKKFKSRNGIATLKNDIYILSVVSQDDRYYYIAGEQAQKVEREICRDIVNANKFINIARVSCLTQKIIFPYEYINGKPVLIKEEVFKKKFPDAYNYLSERKDLLAKRDKGEGSYENWYAYGRNQSLEKYKYKLFFPHISNKIPNFVLNDDENLLFYNGLAMVSDNKNELRFLSKIMATSLFWFYIVTCSRHYGSNYFSLSKNYFKNFGMYEFSDDQVKYILEEKSYERLNSFINEIYDIEFPTDKSSKLDLQTV